MPMINEEMIICSNCTKMFKLKNCEHIYRCGDTYVCSYICSQERYRELKNIDPGFTRPHTWPLIKTRSTNTLFNSEIVAKTNKEPVKNLKEHIIKEQMKHFDAIYEPEDTCPLIIENMKLQKNEKKKNCNDIIRCGFNKMCGQCFVLGVPSLCAVCIIITMTL
jgi:hypothetical protein